jgi:hypothetical protein
MSISHHCPHTINISAEVDKRRITSRQHIITAVISVIMSVKFYRTLSANALISSGQVALNIAVCLSVGPSPAFGHALKIYVRVWCVASV